MATSKPKMEDEIERSQWQGFLDQFSKRNQRRPTRLEVVSLDLGAQEAERLAPFVGASFEPKGSEAGSVEIYLGGESMADARQLNHLIERVEHIYPLAGISGIEDGLGIVDADGNRTLLLFETPAALPGS